jgi:hypothetical protein
VEGRSENAGGAEADEEGEEEARGEEGGPSPPAAASARGAGNTGTAGAHAGDAGDGVARVSCVGVPDVPRVRVAGVRAVREASHCHDAESQCAGSERDYVKIHVQRDSANSDRRTVRCKSRTSVKSCPPPPTGSNQSSRVDSVEPRVGDDAAAEISV